MTQKQVTIAGSGAAGLSAAVRLAALGMEVRVIEQSPFLGGHAVGYACKATDAACVKCGACMVENLLETAVGAANIHLQTGRRLETVVEGKRLTIGVAGPEQFIDPGLCDNCGLCVDKCPAGAVIRGSSPHHDPFYALNTQDCVRNRGEACETCRDACPHQAIQLENQGVVESHETDALVFATGFRPYDPTQKPYGYGLFKNVITNLDLEKEMRSTGRATCPSDGREPARMAFIQCVGSRDARLKHLWCSQVCCGSALRLARLIKSRQPQTDITVFYIDIQRFGKDFETFYKAAQTEINFIRAIPGDAFENDDGSVNLAYAEGNADQSGEATFDLLVLSIGLLPDPDAGQLAAGIGIAVDSDGFLAHPGLDTASSSRGVFAAGTATGPMSIPDAIASGGQVAAAVMRFLRPQGNR